MKERGTDGGGGQGAGGGGGMTVWSWYAILLAPFFLFFLCTMTSKTVAHCAWRPDDCQSPCLNQRDEVRRVMPVQSML